MDLDDIFAEYWPALLGAVVLFFATIFLWPTGDDGPLVEPAVTQLTESGRSRESVSASGSGEEEPLPRTEEEAPEAAPENLPEPNFQIVETLVAVPADETEQLPPRNFDTNDPEVRAALQKVEVALYETKDCAVCARARDFLNHNQISFVRHAVDEDPNVKERMRRLSGATAVPVLVIDGQVLRGFSESAVQGALTSAVKTRVVGQGR